MTWQTRYVNFSHTLPSKNLYSCALKFDNGRNLARSDDSRQLRLNIVDWLQELTLANKRQREEEEARGGTVLDESTVQLRSARDKAASFNEPAQMRKSKGWRGIHHPVTGQYLLPLNVSYYSDM
jgi:hypothetical protein